MPYIASGRKSHGYKNYPVQVLTALWRSGAYRVLVILDNADNDGRKALRKFGHTGRIITVERDGDNHKAQIANSEKDKKADFLKGDIFKYLEKHRNSHFKIGVWADTESPHFTDKELNILRDLRSPGVLNMVCRNRSKSKRWREVKPRSDRIEKILEVDAECVRRRPGMKEGESPSMVMKEFYIYLNLEVPTYRSIDWIDTKHRSVKPSACKEIRQAKYEILRDHGNGRFDIRYRDNIYENVADKALFAKLKIEDKEQFQRYPRYGACLLDAISSTVWV